MMLESLVTKERITTSTWGFVNLLAKVLAYQDGGMMSTYNFRKTGREKYPILLGLETC